MDTKTSTTPSRSSGATNTQINGNGNNNSGGDTTPIPPPQVNENGKGGKDNDDDEGSDRDNRDDDDDDVSFASQKDWPEATPISKRKGWGQYYPFRGMYYDVIRRLPYYWTDWTLAFEKRNLYRVATASIRMYFINVMPALAYIIDMNIRTHGAYGVNEGLLASAMPCIVFSIIGVQPLTIVGVTGLINLMNYTDYDIMTRYGVNYLQFQAWVLIWGAIFHWIVAIFNICDMTRYITDMTSETFGFYVGVIYIQKGIEVIIREFDDNSVQAGWLGCLIAIVFALSVYYMEKVGSLMTFGPFWLRKLIADYGFAIGIVWWTGFAHISGNIKSTDVAKLPITKAFFPTQDRDWVVDFWNLEVKWVFAAIPFGLLLMLLFYFDHNVSSLMAQARHFPVRRPAGFHWDFFLLGCTTFVSGVLGIPAPNGLVPQAPVHTESLSVLKQVDDTNEEDERGLKKPQKVTTWRVVEQRVSHFVIGLLTVGTMTRPLLVALGTMPRTVFAGVFLVVGWGSIEGNGITHKTLYLLRDPKMIPTNHPLLNVPRLKIALYVAIQWFILGIAVAVSQTLAAISFPVFYVLCLIPFRHFYGPKLFTPHELKYLDAPTANSFAVMVSIGGDLTRVTGEGLEVAPDTGIEGTATKMRGTTDDRTPVEEEAAKEAPSYEQEMDTTREGLTRRGIAGLKDRDVRHHDTEFHEKRGEGRKPSIKEKDEEA